MKKILYVDMDDVLCDFHASYRKKLRANPSIQFPQCQYGFFRELEPLEGGIDAVNYLRSKELFDVYILTAPSVLNPLCYTEKRMWIEDHFDLELAKRLIISPNKGLNKGDYLIDDTDFGKGQENFEGKLIHFGFGDFKNWEMVLHYFQQKYKLD